MRRTLATAAATLILATACTSGGDTSQRGEDPIVDISNAELAALQTFDSCDAFLDHVQTEALEHVGPWGFEGGGWWGGPDLMEDDMVMGAADEAVSADSDGGSAPNSGRVNAAQAVGEEGGSAGPEFSETNLQVAGVDEPDIVKTNGELIIALAQNRLHMVDAERAEHLGSVELVDGWGSQLFLAGDKVLAMRTQWGGFPMPTDAATSRIAPEFETEHTVITSIDISDPSNPQVDGELHVDGMWVSARAVDGTARLVLRSSPTRFPFVYPSTPEAEKAAETANRALVAESTIDQWVPSYTLVDPDGGTKSSGVAVPCDQLHAPTIFSGFGMLSVVSIDLTSDDLDISSSAAVLTNGETVYANTSSLYVSTNRWVSPDLDQVDAERVAEDWSTGLHKFDISNPDEVGYEASGTVRGHVLNQFSLDEYEGVLRVATTDGAPWFGGDNQSESFMSTLAQEGEKLVTLDRVGNLGKGEQIQSVRMVQDKAYVVTFRQIDPLYIIDLANPSDIEVKGELKVTGFSSYLQILPDGTLMGIGSAGTEDGRITGLQVSLFDVDDASDPRRTANWTMDDANSEAQWDHKAVTYWDPTQTLFIPIQRWAWDEEQGDDYFTGAIALELADGDIDELGRLSHQQIPPTKNPDCGDGGDCEDEFVDDEPSAPIAEDELYYGAEIRRTIVIGDTVWTFSEAGLQAADLHDFRTTDWVSFN
ncbi:MAG: hypothetical protein GY745_08225 [Actinomycetia bacterium]|nr:hypothetical protein [Actinomycetes bacterium]